MCDCEYFESISCDMIRTIIHHLCSEEYIGSFIDSLYCENQAKMLKIIHEIGSLEDYWGIDENTFKDTIKRFLNSSRHYESFLYDIQAKIGFVGTASDYSKAINQNNVLHLIADNAYWKVLAISVSKCTGERQKDIDWRKLKDIVSSNRTSFLGPYNIFMNAFSSDSTRYSISNMPHLGLMLHKKHSYKQYRKQKKQISRVYKRAKRIMLAYKLYVPKEGYFSEQRHTLPELFIQFIRDEYYD